MRLIKQNMKHKIPIVWQGFALSHAGFAEAVRNYILTLDQQGDFEIKLFPYDANNIQLEKSRKTKKLLEMCKTQIKERPIWITETGPMQIHPTIGYSIGLVVWECIEWPKHFIDNLKKQDELWTPSNFCKDRMEFYGLKNIHLIPHVLDYKRFNPQKVKPLRQFIDPSLFKFLSIMGWSERKGVSALLEAYIKEFTKYDNVLLYIKLSHYDLSKAQGLVNAIRRKIGKKKGNPYIVLDAQTYSWKEIVQLYRTAHAFVLPSRGEGFGLNFAEAMLMELPTIGLNIPPMIDYMNHNNSYLVAAGPYVQDKRCDWISPDYPGKTWPVPSIGHLKATMREVYEHYDVAKRKAKQARQDIIAYSAPEVIGPCMANRLREIWQNMPAWWQSKYNLDHYIGNDDLPFSSKKSGALKSFISSEQKEKKSERNIAFAQKMKKKFSHKIIK